MCWNWNQKKSIRYVCFPKCLTVGPLGSSSYPCIHSRGNRTIPIGLICFYIAISACFFSHSHFLILEAECLVTWHRTSLSLLKSHTSWLYYRFTMLYCHSPLKPCLRLEWKHWKKVGPLPIRYYLAPRPWPNHHVKYLVSWYSTFVAYTHTILCVTRSDDWDLYHIFNKSNSFW